MRLIVMLLLACIARVSLADAAVERSCSQLVTLVKSECNRCSGPDLVNVAIESDELTTLCEGVACGDCPSDLLSCQEDLLTLQTTHNSTLDSLNDCTTDLGTCQSDLSGSEASLSTCTTDLGTCNGELTSCSNDLNTCTPVLSACEAARETVNTTLQQCQSDYAALNVQATSNNNIIFVYQIYATCRNTYWGMSDFDFCMPPNMCEMYANLFENIDIPGYGHSDIVDICTNQCDCNWMLTLMDAMVPPLSAITSIPGYPDMSDDSDCVGGCSSRLCNLSFCCLASQLYDDSFVLSDAQGGWCGYGDCQDECATV